MTAVAKRWLILGGAALGLVLLGWIISSTRWFAHSAPIPRLPRPPRESTRSATPSGSEPPLAEQQDWHIDYPEWIMDAVVIVMYVLIAAVVLAIVAFLVYRLVTSRPNGWDLVEERAATQPDAEQLREALRAGLSDIDAGGDARKAVIACWLRLERLAAEAGLARLESETPTDLVTRMLAAGDVDDAALRQLAAVYQRARYAPHTVDAAERTAARAALAAVAEQLTVAVGEST